MILSLPITELSLTYFWLTTYLETDYDIFKDKKSVDKVVNYVTGVFNQSATLFDNEHIPIVLSEMFVWDKPSPYTANDAKTLLIQFQSNRNSFNGDFGHLLAFRGDGGIAAGFSGFCNSNIDQTQCFSGIRPGFRAVPTYSWTIYVFTHEMGHLMGSRHTHACGWNGNKTAIDGCGDI
jgi:Metallo-peptidase family M12